MAVQRRRAKAPARAFHAAHTPETTTARSAESKATAIKSDQTWLCRCSDLFVFGVCLAVYSRTMLMSIPGGDAGELAVSACTCGVAHPPGYPTFTLLYHAVLQFVRFLGLNQPPSLVFNFWSACLTSAAMVLFHQSIYQFVCDSVKTDSRIPHHLCVSVSTALALGFSPTIWLYAGQAEVFALHNFFSALLLLLTVWVFAKPTLSRTLVCAFASGLALTNQHTSVLYIVPVALVLIGYHHNMLLKPLSLFCILLAIVLGMLPYAWLPYASHQHYLDSWGDQSTLGGFLHHLLRKEYGTFQLAGSEIASNDGIRDRLGLYVQFLFAETLYIAPLMAAFGLWTLSRGQVREKRSTAIAILSGFIFYIFIFHWRANLGLTPLLQGIMARFWQQPNQYVMFFAAVGLCKLQEKTLRRRFCHYLFKLALMAFVMIQIGVNWESRDLHLNREIQLYGESILAAMPQNAIVLVNGDLNNNAVKYIIGCEGRRKDLRVISMQLMSWPWFVSSQAMHYPGVIFPGKVYHPFESEGFSMKEFLDANIRTDRPVYSCGPWKEGDLSHQGFYVRWPAGLCDLILPEGERPSNLTQFYRTALNTIPVLPASQGLNLTPDLWERIVYEDAWSIHQSVFNSLCVDATSPDADPELLALAAESAKTLLFDKNLYRGREVWPLPAPVLRNAGVIMGMHSVIKPQFQRLMLKAWRLYLQHPHDSEPKDESIRFAVNSQVNPYRGGNNIE